MRKKSVTAPLVLLWYLVQTTSPAVAAPGTGKAAAPGSLRIHLIGWSREYAADTSLAAWQQNMEREYRVRFTRSFAPDKSRKLPGLEDLRSADLLVVYCRRLRIPNDRLELIQDYVKSGRPVLGMRTASHAFQNWLEFDRDVFGGSYNGHGPDETVRITIPKTAADHPVVAKITPWQWRGKLYRNEKNAEDTITLLIGKTEKASPPVAWVRVLKRKQRIFYTSLGTPEDFESPHFNRLLVNAVTWLTRNGLEKTVNEKRVFLPSPLLK